MYPTILTDAQRLCLLDIPPHGELDAVLDTDAYNEIDDQFAICYALRSPGRIKLEAIYAAPFVHLSPETGLLPGERAIEAGEGMELSYREILRLLGLLKIRAEGFAFRGVDRFLQDENTPVDNPAARDLIERALRHSPENPLYVLAIGAPTNVASALLLAPEIQRNIAVIWQGGNAVWWPHTRDYNLMQDVPASRVLLNSGVALYQVPAMGGTCSLYASVPELEACLGGGPVSKALLGNVRRYAEAHGGGACYNKEIWDIGAVALLVDARWMPSYLIHSPILADGLYWARDPRRHLIRTVYEVKRNEIMADMVGKVRGI